jgi:hypothetical protein
MDQSAVNPLTKYFRQPAIYLKLPSQGRFWPEGALNLPLNNEIPVLPMSTKDEIILKTPDALLNGQGVVDVIQSCCPNIVDAWQTPSVDVDAIIIAIRIASYGNSMDFESQCPHCTETSDYAIDLTRVLEGIACPAYTESVTLDQMEIKIKPQAYFSVNKSNMIAFEEQQLLRSLGTMEDNPEQAAQSFNQHIAKLVDLNAEILAGSTDHIRMASGESVVNPLFIAEFYKNCEPSIVKQVRALIESHSKQAGLAPVEVNCHHCEQPFKVSITFDFASFFGKGS